jgi:hypothetical protein
LAAVAGTVMPIVRADNVKVRGEDTLILALSPVVTGQGRKKIALISSLADMKLEWVTFWKNIL